MTLLPAIVTPRETKRLQALISHDKKCAAWLRGKPPVADIAKAIVVELGDGQREGIIVRLRAAWLRGMRDEMNKEIRRNTA